MINHRDSIYKHSSLKPTELCGIKNKSKTCDLDLSILNSNHDLIPVKNESYSNNDNNNNNNKNLDKSNNQTISDKHRTRFNVALLGLTIAVVNFYAQATFCISIVEMVYPADYSQVSNIENNNTSNLNSSSSALPKLQNSFDQSCPIEYKYKDYYDSWRFPEINNTNNLKENVPLDLSNRFDWDASQQGILLGAFAIGTAPLQIIGGRLAEIYGAKWVLLAGCIGSAVTNLTIPWIAHFSFLLLIANRIFMGISQAGLEPGLMCLLAKWLSPSETGYYISMIVFAICIGFFFGSLCTSFILSVGYGWPLTFFISGSLNLFIGLIWFLYGSSSPEESKIISREELEYIKREQERGKGLESTSCDISITRLTTNCNILPVGEQLKVDKNLNDETSLRRKALDSNSNLSKENLDQQTAPWSSILSTPSVWAFVICKFSIRWSGDVLALELPIYLANVLHLSIKLNGILNSISSALFSIFSFFSGYLADKILKKLESRGKESNQQIIISKTTFRKIIQSIASFGSALTVFLMTQYDCNLLFSMSMMLVLSCLLVIGTGGELQIPYDMTSRYPGTLHGMACTLSVSGWLAPPLIGLILADQPTSRYRWSLVWYLTAFINLFGGLVFVFFADASPREFISRRNKKEKKQNEGNQIKPEHFQGSFQCKGPNSHGHRPLTNASDNNRNVLQQAGSDESPLFDRKLIKVRQLEESYIERPSYLADFDSVLLSSEPIIYPYRDDSSKTSNENSLSSASNNSLTNSNSNSKSKDDTFYSFIGSFLNVFSIHKQKTYCGDKLTSSNCNSPATGETFDNIENINANTKAEGSDTFKLASTSCSSLSLSQTSTNNIVVSSPQEDSVSNGLSWLNKASGTMAQKPAELESSTITHL